MCARKDYGEPGKPRNHFATKTTGQPATTESGLARRTRRLTQIWNKNSSSASIPVFSGQRPFFPCFAFCEEIILANMRDSDVLQSSAVGYTTIYSLSVLSFDAWPVFLILISQFSHFFVRLGLPCFSSLTLQEFDGTFQPPDWDYADSDCNTSNSERKE